MTPDELTELRELHEKASPAPWMLEPYREGEEISKPMIYSIANSEEHIISQLGCGCCDVGLGSSRLANFELTVEVRNALPGLLGYIESLTWRAEHAEARLARIKRAHPEIYEQALAASTAAEARAWEEGFTQGAAYYHESGKEPADFTETAATLNPYKEQSGKDNA